MVLHLVERLELQGKIYHKFHQREAEIVQN